VDMNLMTNFVDVNVTGYTAHASPVIALTRGRGRPLISPSAVVIKGSWQATGQTVDGRFDIEASDVPLDDQIVEALPRRQTDFQKLARSFNATGKGDIKARIIQGPDVKDFHNEYHVRFHDAAIRWDLFPYPLEQVSGFLDIYPTHWEFREGRGTHRGSVVL